MVFPGAHDQGPFDHVFQLPHISRPTVVMEKIFPLPYPLFCRACRYLSSSVYFARKCFVRIWRSSGLFLKGGQNQIHHIQSKKQVFPKTAFLNLLF